MSTEEHRKAAPATVRCAVLTISDTRTEETDRSGQLIRQLLSEHQYVLADYQIIKDERNLIEHAILDAAAASGIDAILLNGGTGIAARDTTHEAVQALLDKEMPGFGELFRYLSYTEDIGSAAILSRAIAGVYRNTAVFSMPGSTGAVRLAMNKLILPELRHVVHEINKQR